MQYLLVTYLTKLFTLNEFLISDRIPTRRALVITDYGLIDAFVTEDMTA